MAGLTDQEIDLIAQRIVAGMSGHDGVSGKDRPAAPAAPSVVRDLGVFDSIDEAVRAASIAFCQFDQMGLQKRNTIIAAIRDAMREHGSALAREAHEETGLGRYEDKVIKNQLVTEKTPGTEDLQPHAVTGDHGLNLTEPAPYGVIAAITPTTNPTSTIINNTIAMVAAGNAVVFNVHPNAKRVSCHNVALINKAIVAAGGPKNLITCIASPTVESAQALMKHPGVRLLVVTGGGGVVQAAMSSGKRAVCAGPGNPPVVVDETADIDKAARDIVFGASFDNNIICADEKECLVVSSVADQLIKGMTYNGALLVTKEQLPALEKVVFKKTYGPRKEAEIDRSLIGRNASYILQKAGIRCDESVRLGIVEVDHDHPLLWTEQMMPIFPITRVRDADEGIDFALALEHPRRHTFVMHSENLSNLSRMARECNASIFVKNGPSQAGLGWKGEGYTSFTIASPTGEGMTGAAEFFALAALHARRRIQDRVMRKYPTLAVIEFGSIADGIYCTDALLKKAPIAMIKSGTVSHGRYLIIIGGSTGSVEESFNEALSIGQASVLDHAFLPDVHTQVHDAVLGRRLPIEQDAVAILETDTVAAHVRAAELALKGVKVQLVELRLAEYEMSGKAISLYNGELHEVEAAMELAGDFLRGRKEYVQHRIICQPHEVLTQHLAGGTRFAATKPHELEGEEVS